MQLRPHLQSFLHTDIAIVLTYGPESAILAILLECGRILLQMRNDHELTELLDQVFHEFKADPEDPSPASLPFYDLSASNLLNQGKYEEAEYLNGRALSAREKVLGPEHPDTLTSMANLASTYWDQSRWKEAEELQVQAMETSKKVLGDEHPDTLASMANLAHTYKAKGCKDKAVQLMETVIRLQQEISGPEHPHTIASTSTLASWMRP